VWVQDESADPEKPSPSVYYSFHNGTAWSAPARVSGENAVVGFPKVVFVAPPRGLAVWEQNKLSRDDADMSDGVTLLSNGELYYALWDGLSWSAPAPITNDQAFDAKPMLAADPSTARAMLVWLRVNQPSTSDQVMVPDGVYYTTFDGRQWSAPALIDPRSSGVDSQATIKFNQRGQAVALWVRDVDRDISTSEDRRILMSPFDGRAWTAPEAIPNLPAGTFTPAFAFDKDNTLIVVFVVPATNPETGRLASGDGSRSALYSAYRRGNTWEVVAVGQNTYAENPVVSTQIKCSDTEARRGRLWASSAIWRVLLGPTAALKVWSSELTPICT
jgi:hypothetical protein